MLHILLMILKVLGIILLCIIGVVLLLIALVLFVPLRYRIKAIKEETIDEQGQTSELSESIYARIKATWLCHFISVTAEYKGELLCKVRVLGIVVYDIAKKDEYAARKAEKEKRKAEKEKRKAEKERHKKEKEKQKLKKQKQNHTIVEKKQIATVCDKTEISGSKQNPEDEIITNTQTAEDNTSEKLTWIQKVVRFIQKLKELFYKFLEAIQNIQYTFEKFYDKIKDAINQVEYYKEVWAKEETKLAIATAKEQLGKLIKHLKPSKFKADIHLGVEDPATLGQILSIHGMLYPYIGKNVRIVPDFEKEVLEGTIYIKGRITVFVLLRIAWILYFDKNIRYLIRLLKKEDK